MIHRLRCNLSGPLGNQAGSNIRRKLGGASRRLFQHFAVRRAQRHVAAQPCAIQKIAFDLVALVAECDKKFPVLATRIVLVDVHRIGRPPISPSAWASTPSLTLDACPVRLPMLRFSGCSVARSGKSLRNGLCLRTHSVRKMGTVRAGTTNSRPKIRKKDCSLLMIVLRISLTIRALLQGVASAPRSNDSASYATLAPPLFDERPKSRKIFPASKLGL